MTTKKRFYTFCITAFALILQCVFVPLFGEEATPPAKNLPPSDSKIGYNPDFNVLAWGEEFNGVGAPNPNKWGYEKGHVRNSELQLYTDSPQNVRKERGMLVIEAHKGTDGKITSASLNTFGKADFEYGRIEVRARVPMGVGVWPAIWMKGIDFKTVKWPKCGEIDIMEYVWYRPNVFFSNVHTYGSLVLDKGKPPSVPKGWEVKLASYRDFHVFAVERYPDKLRFFIDGKLVGEYPRDERFPEHWHFDKPMFLLINLAIGGSWGGQKGVDDAIFPARYEIDYVRYYR